MKLQAFLMFSLLVSSATYEKESDDYAWESMKSKCKSVLKKLGGEDLDVNIYEFSRSKGKSIDIVKAEIKRDSGIMGRDFDFIFTSKSSVLIAVYVEGRVKDKLLQMRIKEAEEIDEKILKSAQKLEKYLQ